ncbi:MAG: substrate-binding domain-containing protein [Polyangiaceae bacterium]
MILNRRALNVFALGLTVLAVGAILARNLHANAPLSLLNVSYDPTRELYAKLNPLFAQQHARSGGKPAQVRQAHGGSTRQARSVISGELDADVVTLGLPSDVDALRKRGLLPAGLDGAPAERVAALLLDHRVRGARR